MKPIPITGILSPWEPGVFGLVVFAFMIFALMAILFFVIPWLGEKKREPEKTRPYECGIIPTGSLDLGYPIPFYLVAIFFLIFDVEGAFIFSWAVAGAELGRPGWLAITFFIVLLLLGLAYIWRKGGLEWGTTER
jgi:NADH-quinone oxidoreductase subunit A